MPTPSITINQITFNDTTTINLTANDIILIVGPNNSGKSATLRAIKEKLADQSHKDIIINEIKITKSGSRTDLINWIKEWALEKFDSGTGRGTYYSMGIGMVDSDHCPSWDHYQNSIPGISRWFCHLISAEERLSICIPSQNINFAQEPITHPIQFLYKNDKVESQVNAKFRKAFGTDITIHRGAGSIIPIHVGEKPLFEENEDRVSTSYLRKLEKLPLLHTQGDGMRSFAGILLSTSIDKESILLIDEPEAFLHPPQARLIGNMLVQDKKAERQLFISTHSADVLRGALDADATNLRVIRIQRIGNKNVIKQLINEQIKTLWKDPLLRYSNILDGLFHESVVICESDGDCLFFGATVDAIHESTEKKRPDIMFTHCGGKHRLPVVINALKELNVPVKVVADFDVLSEQNTLQQITTAIGINWDEIKSDWTTIKKSIDELRPELTAQEVKSEIHTILSTTTERLFPDSASKKIQAVIKKSSAWAHAKSSGTAFIPAGNATQAFQRLSVIFKKNGLFIVEVGELECFCKSIGGHGPKWVNEVLQRNLKDDPELAGARSFVLELIENKT